MVDIPEVVREYIFKTVSLSKIVTVRVNYIVDPILKKKLEKPNEVRNAIASLFIWPVFVDWALLVTFLRMSLCVFGLL